MTSGNVLPPGSRVTGYRQGYGAGGGQPANLADILERVLDKGLVIAGDIKVNLLDIELLTIKLRLVIASLDTAREVGINWWETDPWLNAQAAGESADRGELEEENRELRRRVAELESGDADGHDPGPRRGARDSARAVDLCRPGRGDADVVAPGRRRWRGDGAGGPDGRAGRGRRRCPAG